MSYLIIILLEFYSQFCSAEILKNPPRNVLIAKSESEFNVLKKGLAEANLFKKACQWELSKKMIPSHCYKPLALNWSLDKYDYAMGELDRLCVWSARESQNIALLVQKSQVDGVSSFCRRTINRRVEILKYQSDQRPGLE